MNTQNRSKKLLMDLSGHALNSMLQVKLSVMLSSKDLTTCGFQKKNSRHTHWSWAQFQKGQPTRAKLHILFPAHLWVREFFVFNFFKFYLFIYFIFYLFIFIFTLFECWKISSKNCVATYKCCQAYWMGHRPHQSDTPPYRFQLLPWEKANRSKI